MARSSLLISLALTASLVAANEAKVESRDIENAHQFAITALAFSDSGKFIASGSAYEGDSGLFGKSRVEVADASTGKSIAFLKGKLREEIIALRFISDDNLLIVSRRKAVIWTVPTGKLKWLLESEKRCIGIGKDGKSVVYVHEQDDTIQTRDWADDKGDAVDKVERLKFWHEKYPALERVLEQETLDRFAFSVDWTRFLTINSHAATVWDTQTGKELKSVHDIGTIASVAVSPDNASLAVGTSDGKVKLASVAADDTNILNDDKGEVTALVFSKDGDLLAVGRDNHSLTILKMPKVK